ncbi:P-loop NTPase fold protein [Pseudomonas sp. MM211]|uniref:P-loop NTPase fold protein n=1 Tax=Pseudomonas sp. MM211 TaxID=2866808 RepID=UPI001CEDF773|nr:P-loop NTPase fold protein [Pseudomonas sp. MM211]
MSRVTFQSEQPSELDVFPGGSHEKVATAICNYVADDQNSRVIGLDGEFGSGKSSILKMLDLKLRGLDSKYKVWFFDCEQNYQGSIKSNFIELFTDELLKTAGTDEGIKKELRDSRDKALGRHFTYSKSTTSRVSAWALVLVVTLFFSSSSFRELFALTKLKDPVPAWIYVLHVLSLLSPLITLGCAWWQLKDTKVGDQRWSVFHLFKGGSDDTITEKIQVAKEVTPLDLKRILEADLNLFNDTHYIVILDNLDRLPKDSLRSVWSDLEIFTWASAENNLTTIVPFCSNKVAQYLSADQDRTYDSRDFIAKKFPVVFRAPPIITAGWKDGFYRLWESTYPDGDRDVAEKCALLLQRHSPMASKLVTPRLQKRFINDIATTSLTLGGDINLVSIAAHLLLCKYNAHPLQEVIRTGGFSDAYKNASEHLDDKDVVATQQLLGAIVGSEIEGGWQIQFLQIHFLTTSDIAIAELIDEPLSLAVQEQNGERFASLVTVFGFRDALRRYLYNGGYQADLIQTIHLAAESLDEQQLSLVTSIIDTEPQAFVGEPGEDALAFYDALKTCRQAGLRTDGFARLKKNLDAVVRKAANEPVLDEDLSAHLDKLVEYDRCLDALGATIASVTANNAAYFIHVVAQVEDLRVIEHTHFVFSKQGSASILQHIASGPETPAPIISLTEEQREYLLEFAYSGQKSGQDAISKLSDVELKAVTKAFMSNPADNGALFAFALHREVNDSILTTLVAQPFTGRTTSQNSAVAAILLAAQKYSELVKIEDLDSVVSSDVFKLFFRSGGTSEPLTSGFEEEEVEQAIARIFAWAVKEDAIWRLSHTYVSGHFATIASTIAPYGVAAQQLFDWLNDWQRHMFVTFASVEAMDNDFVRRLTFSADQQYLVPKSTALEYYRSQERSEQEWADILRSASPNHAVLIDMLKTKDGFQLASSARKAIVGILREKASTPAFNIDKNSVATIQTVIGTIDQSQKNLLGADIRTLIYSEGSISGQVAWILETFGDLIVDVQPSSTMEVGKLMGILDYLSESPDESAPTLKFLDNRAGQISAYRYSQELRKAMAIAVAKLSKTAPNLFQAFAKKTGFKGLLKELMRPDRKTTQADPD